MTALDIQNYISWELKEMKEWEIYKIDGSEIITVVSWKVFDPMKWILNTFESSCFYKWTIQSKTDTLLSIFTIEDENVLLDKINVNEFFGDFCRWNWKKLCELQGCEMLTNTDLYRWDQRVHKFNGIEYKFNLWFCGPNVDCLWHNQHNFIETHTNLAWAWYMQKSVDGTDSWLVETYGLLPWNSHRTFNIPWQKEKNGNPKYPMHRWLGGNTGNVWFVIEKY